MRKSNIQSQNVGETVLNAELWCERSGCRAVERHPLVRVHKGWMERKIPTKTVIKLVNSVDIKTKTSGEDSFAQMLILFLLLLVCQ